MRSAILVLGAVLVSACTASSPAQPAITFRILGVADLPGIQTPAPSVRAIRTRADWDAFVQQSGLRAPSGDPAHPLPPIDFSSEMAIVVQLGGRPTTGYRISVDQVARDGSDLVVHVTEMPPCVGATVITYPVAAIAVPQDTAGVSAVWAKATPVCP